MTRRALPMGVTRPDDASGIVRRFPLNRRMILSGAVTLIDESDLAHLTMRRLGAALGVEGMTLYGYVHSREDLLDGIVDLVVEELREPTDGVSAGDWPQYVTRLAHGVRRIALEHPQVFPLVATRTAIAPWVQPPLRSLRWTESLLEVLHRSGFSDPAVVTAYRVFTSFLLGHLLPEVAAAGVDITPNRPPGRNFDPCGLIDPVLYPQLSRLCRELGRDHSTVEFEESLATLVHRLHTLHTAPGATLVTGHSNTEQDPSAVRRPVPSAPPVP